MEKLFKFFLLERFGGLFLFYCNYDVKYLSIPSQFYSSLLQWWSEFRDDFDKRKEWKFIVWNKKEIRVNNQPIIYRNCFENGIIHVSDLLFHMDTSNLLTISSHLLPSDSCCITHCGVIPSYFSLSLIT